jgi:hypothetical protein
MALYERMSCGSRYPLILEMRMLEIIIATVPGGSSFDQQMGRWLLTHVGTASTRVHIIGSDLLGPENVAFHRNVLVRKEMCMQRGLRFP